MKKKIKEVVGVFVFLLGVCVMLVGFSYILKPMKSGNYRAVFTGFYAEEENTLDIVALGSSSVYRFFNNPVLWEECELTSWNLATGSQPIEVLEALVEEVEKTQSPQLYVVETRQFLKTDSVDEEDFGSDESEEGVMDGMSEEEIALHRVTDNMYYSKNRYRLINEQVEGWENRIEYHFDFLRYHRTWEDYSLDHLDNVDNKSKHELKGWSNVFKRVPIDPPTLPDTMEPMPISEYNEKVLVEFMEYCREKDIQVLFVSSPWKITKKNYRRNLYLQDLIESYGFNFLNCNLYYEEIGLDFATDFYDKKHTNRWGAEKFTRFLGDYILENYDIDTKHPKHVRKDWDKAVKANKQDIVNYVLMGEEEE